MENVSILVVDDEPLLLQGLANQIVEFWPGCRETVRLAANGKEALAIVENERPDIVFLDILMPGIDGIELARRLVRLDIVPLIVFTTAFSDHAIDAFEINAVDYLLKPIVKVRLKATLDRLAEKMSDLNQTSSSSLPAMIEDILKTMNLQPKNQYLEWIKASRMDNLHLISVHDVQYFQASEKYTEVHTKDAEYIIRTSVKELAKQLDPALFWQIHRATLVNSRCIDVVSKNFAGHLNVSLRYSHTSLKVSRNFRHLFKQM